MRRSSLTPARTTAPRLLGLAAAVLTLPVLASCTEAVPSAESDTDGDGRTVTVTSSADECEVSTGEVPSGTLTFNVTNTGSEVTEFYLLAEDGLTIKGEIENIGPQATRQLVLAAPAGDYVTACKPGMVGEGIRSDFVVTDSGEDVAVTADEQELVDTAVANYATYVEDQADQLLEKTRQFVELYEDGQDDEARALYPIARTHWERIETVAESFGDLDPKMDLREADLSEGEEWTGWHRIEKDLWPARATDYTALSAKERSYYAQDLLANTEELVTRIGDLTYTVDQIANGSRGLLEEVATGKVTGEEEYWSRTDLYDFQANVDGARVGFEGVEPLLETKDPELAASLRTRFTQLDDLLAQYRTGDDFVGYDELTQAQVKELSDAVNALSEPLSQLTAALLA
ncbi:iron uptake system protein EfeO [Nocardioides bruguierae]|uniref:Cupredoxin domain-containing protein n=1 Tax=Nocardioides bruguierae TaxID=2945102 RepID=A0A9X2D5T9_9ACTN|nr:iron uptake system protein EfeO [Nocardioides bruguierae]MCM0619728.1 cupredoxin domain-containing protein [Nocardioides bruguierae]